jgi:hypothetical protein
MNVLSPIRQGEESELEPGRLESDDMAWARPEYRRGEVDWAGRRLAQLMHKTPWDDGDSADWLRAITIINNWRSVHAYPLNTFQATLRGKAQKID